MLQMFSAILPGFYGTDTLYMQASQPRQ